MLRDLKLDVFYPYSPERVWKAIANRRALAAWLMENDFEPQVGHKFRFVPQPEPGVEGTIYCEVIELDEPRSLSYTWRGSLTCKPTIVTLRLVPVDGGTQLQLEHQGFESEVTKFSQPIHLAQAKQNNSTFKATLETQLLEPVNQRMLFQPKYQQFKSFDGVTLNFYLSGGWHSALNSRLKKMLTDIAEDSLRLTEFGL